MNEVVALALGIAASPFSIIPAVLLLFTERPRAAALTFLGTWFISIALIVSVFAVLSEVISFEERSSTWLDWVRIVAGVGLIAFAVWKWVTRPPTIQMPTWMNTLQTATPRSACVLAIVLSVANPKVLLLAAAGGIDIGNVERLLQQHIAAIGVFAFVASISVATPIVAYTVAGPRVLGPLSNVKDWLMRNNVAVMSVVFVVLGALLINNGVSGL